MCVCVCVPLQHAVGYVGRREDLDLPAQQVRGRVNCSKQLLPPQHFGVLVTGTQQWYKGRRGWGCGLPATPVSFNSSVFERAQKQVPYTIGPEEKQAVLVSE